MKRLLILGAPVFQIPVIEKAHEMGLYVGVVDFDESAPGIKFADEYFCASIKDYDKLLEIAEAFEPDGIMSGACDTSVVSVAKLCNALELPGHSIEAAVNSTDKLQMLYAFEKNGVSHPKFQLVNKAELENFKINVGYPAISKPVDSSGSRGISFIENEEKLMSALKSSIEASASGQILVEEYMEGPEVSVEMLVMNGRPYVLQITDKITTGVPYFIEVGHSQPSVLDDITKQKIKEVASKAVLAVGLFNSVAHVEVKITSKGVKMVELGARLGGGCISSYLIDNSVIGIDMTKAAIKIALSENLDDLRFKDSGDAVLVRFILNEIGEVDGVSGIDEAEMIPGIIKVLCLAKCGQKYNSNSSNSSRIVYVVAKGKNRQEAEKICSEAISKIKIRYKR